MANIFDKLLEPLSDYYNHAGRKNKNLYLATTLGIMVVLPLTLVYYRYKYRGNKKVKNHYG